ncbi:DUF3427 domain-containing protein [Vibrio cyclitrophicus]|uniref:DUF3427 domain-containing protein n=1 Tax=Vibrio cyclitrophicus TaxID=47951 RepID=UPI000C827EB1|nr:DUF3427 domain-containing protein [Vibrio cyclitrophicus]PME51367.1 hypothetical protein BCV35_06390 [Vibrio cyclitrophicus]PMF14361.1 hypothetical protein BCV20_10395 [Vibrio cyclitrophicus]
MENLVSNSGTAISLAPGTGRISNLLTLSSPLSTSNIYSAVEVFEDLDGKVSTYKDSTDYDVIINGNNYPPKAIFGLALSELLDATVQSKHFAGGKTSECFKVLQKLGFEIRDKIKRETEIFDYSNFEIGKLYSKLEAIDLAGAAPPKQVRDITGITRFKNCVVLFVTLNKEDKEDAHKYKDSFVLGGKQFHWESQNANTPSTPHMEMIINKEPVVLFARVHQKIKSKTQPFVYVGQLSCIDYSYPIDSKKIPVEVIYQVLDHQHPASGFLGELYSWTSHEELEANDKIDISDVVLTETEAPKPSTRKKSPKKGTRNATNKTNNWADIDERNRNLGLAGEELVIAHEKQYLMSIGLSDLADKITHVAKKDDYAGYDVKSFDENGTEKFIEVKTTEKTIGTAFFISRNEVEVSRELGSQYWVYRVYDLNKKTGKAKFYPLNGPVEDHFDLVPENYKARVK